MFQIALFGERPTYHSESDLTQWSRPFAYAVEGNACIIIMRGLAVLLPISRDPSIPIAVNLPIRPTKYTYGQIFRHSLIKLWSAISSSTH